MTCTKWSLGVGVTLALGIAFGCSSNASSQGGAIGVYQRCSSDSECPASEGCDTEGGSLSDGYCTPLCDTDNQCPTGFSCPAGVRDQAGECDEAGKHKGRGICDQFDGTKGPNTCKSSSLGAYQRCSSDSECPANEGCDTEGNGDGYCTPLCDTNSQCPTGFSCPAGLRDQPGECDEVGTHKGRGICDQFDGSKGPNTCKPSQ